MECFLDVQGNVSVLLLPIIVFGASGVPWLRLVEYIDGHLRYLVVIRGIVVILVDSKHILFVRTCHSHGLCVY